MKFYRGVKTFGIMTLAVLAANMVTGCGDLKNADNNSTKNVTAEKRIDPTVKVIHVLYPQRGRDGKTHYIMKERACVVSGVEQSADSDEKNRKAAFEVNDKGQLVFSGNKGFLMLDGNKVAVIVNEKTLKEIIMFLNTSAIRLDEAKLPAFVLQSEFNAPR